MKPPMKPPIKQPMKAPSTINDQRPPPLDTIVEAARARHQRAYVKDVLRGEIFVRRVLLL